MMKKSSMKEKMKLKNLEKTTVNRALHKDTLFTHLCILDRPRPLSEIKAFKWTSCKSLPFACLMFSVVYNLAIKKLHLSVEHKVIFWQRYGAGLDLLNNLSIHYKRDIIAAQLFNYFDSIVSRPGQPLDPLQLALIAKKYAGDLILLRMPQAPKKASTNKRWKRWKQAEECENCKSRSCSNEKHKKYWIKKNNF